MLSVLADTGKFSEAYRYFSTIEGTKTVYAIKQEFGGGPKDEQSQRATLRTAQFRVPDSGEHGVVTPRDGDTLVAIEGDTKTVWGFCGISSQTPGAWVLDFTTGTTTAQGRNRPPGL